MNILENRYWKFYYQKERVKGLLGTFNGGFKEVPYVYMYNWEDDISVERFRKEHFLFVNKINDELSV